MRLAGCRFALPLALVAEVGRPPALTRVPGLPEWVAGAANWRGRVLAVLDVRPLLGGARDALDRRGRVVVLSRQAVQVGIVVEDVLGTVAVDVERVEPALACLPERTASLLSGQVTDEGGPVGLLDVDALVALADELPRARRTA